MNQGVSSHLNEFQSILNELSELHNRKKADYGSGDDPLGNIRSAVRLGLNPLTGVFLRMQDKFARLESFQRKGSLINEGVDDTLRDIAVYAIIGLILKRESE